MVKANIIKHYPAAGGKIHLIYNGVDLRRFTPENKVKWYEKVRNDLALRHNAKLLLFVGSGFKRKGLQVLIEALSFVENKDTHLLVIGRGHADKFKALADRHGIANRVIFVPPQAEIEKYYAASDLFVLPTLYDPFSNATLEAMASGLPAITTRNNGAAELIENGREGFVLDNMFDPLELAADISAALENTQVMGEAARQKADGFSIDKTACAFAEMIEMVIHFKNSANPESFRQTG